MPGAIPHSILPTVLDHCTHAIRGEDDDFRDLSVHVHRPLLVPIKGGGGLYLNEVHLAEHNTQHHSQSTYALLSPDIGTRLNQLLL